MAEIMTFTHEWKSSPSCCTVVSDLSNRVIKVQPLILGIEFHGTFLLALNDSIDIVVDY